MENRTGQKEDKKWLCLLAELELVQEKSHGHAGESWSMMVLSDLCMGKETMRLTMHVGVQKKKKEASLARARERRKERKASSSTRQLGERHAGQRENEKKQACWA